ncbi:hypothetical protein SKAU_G00240390 [Synaphobranchus kaupii]|uniref:Uncharacterized protein n=1 Tax=Synaphobranchus kaupii TaxID=118154 RepID=A0A9Q1F7J0_SYNKA|nr:hypothetical protein SKAU_G00240390 [Synaphobranchus kaupii]
MWVLKWCLTFIFTTTVTTVLYSPYNVTMEAVNTRYILLWDWDQTQANYTMTFTSAYTYSNNKHIEESYRTACNRTAKRQCDFSHQNLFYSASYVVRVRAEGKRESSPWFVRRFCPDEQASLGPPSRVEVRSGEAMLNIIIAEPLTVYNTSMSTILPLSYRVQYWEKHNPQRVIPDSLDGVEIGALWRPYHLLQNSFR